MKSKKRLLPALMVFVVAFCCVLLAGCTRNPADIEILSGEIVCEVNDKDIQPDWSSVKAKVTFEDGMQETVNGKDLVFSHVDVSTVGQKTVQVGYKEGSFRKDIVVYVVESTTIKATVNAYNGTYDGASYPAVDVQGTLAGDTIMYKLEGSSTWVQTCPQLKDAGETTVMVKITREHCPDFETTVTATVAKKSLTIKGKYYTYTFGETIPSAFDYVIEGLVDGETASILTKQPTATAEIEDSDYVKYEDGTKKLKAGTYTVSFSGAEAKNYSIGYQNGTLKIEKASYDMSQVRWSDSLIEYKAGVQQEITLLNLPDGVTATYTGNTATEIDTYTATAVLSYDTKNYIAPELPAGVELTKTWSIAENIEYTKIDMPTEDTTVFTYNGQNQTYLPNGFDSNKMYIQNNVQKNANETGYPVTVSLKEGYAWANAKVGEGTNDLTFSFVINKLTAQLVWGETTFYYTGEQQAPTCTVNNLCSGDTCNVTVSGGQINANASHGGTPYPDIERYTVTARALDNGNYKLPDGDNTTQFDIRKAENSWITTPSIEVSSTVEGVLTPRYTGGARFGYDIVKRYYKVSTADDSAYLTELPSKDGEYIMKSVIEETNNYTGLESTCTFYISKAVVESMFSNLLAKRNSENFEDKTRPIFAGQQNYFDLQLIGNVQGESGLKEVIAFSTTIKAYIKNGGYTELDSTSLSTYISEINNFKNYVLFKEEAIGKTFKFEITKAGTPRDITIEEVQVVDGYNVYTADDLCVINNRVDESNNEVRGWESKKAGTKYADLTVNSIVLQKDINIIDSNIPSEFFFTEEEASGIPTGITNLEIVGSMKDGDDAELGDKNERAIYERNVAEGQTFSIYGNYFTIDYSGLTRCVVESGNKSAINTDDVNGENETLITTHATVFKFNGLDTTAGQTGENAGTVNFFDLRIKGNGERSNRSLYSGGIMAGKLFHINSNVINSIYKNTFIGFLVSDACANGSKTTTTFLNTKGYDCYNTLIYSYGVSNLTIKGGEYLRAGGPVMIVDHVGGSKVDGSGGVPSNITVIGAKMESFVTGNEPWFVGYGASALVAQIKALDSAFTPFGTTFMQTKDGIPELMNLKVVYKSSSSEGITGQPVRGSVVFYDSEKEYEQNQAEGAEKTVYALDMTTNSIAAASAGEHIIQNSKNNGLFKVSATTGTQNPSETYGLKATEGTTNLNFYLANGMGAVFELYAKQS